LIGLQGEDWIILSHRLLMVIIL